ncbi:hypothetical protein BC831DRAFT_474427 [Entophlyctis helioformis]|nr:hypothetical protein BC831DRAFT_474427 [Entophlyctis helioformis]
MLAAMATASGDAVPTTSSAETSPPLPGRQPILPPLDGLSSPLAATRLDTIRNLLLAMSPLTETRGSSTQQHSSSLTASTVQHILEALPSSIRADDPAAYEAALDLVSMLVTLDFGVPNSSTLTSDVALNAGAAQAAAEMAIDTSLLALVPHFLAASAGMSRASHDTLTRLLLMFMSASNRANELISVIVQHGLESDASWQVRAESARLITALVHRDAGGIDMPRLAASLIARLRDVSGAVVDESLRALARIHRVVGQDALLGFVAGLPRGSRQVFRQHQDAIMSGHAGQQDPAQSLSPPSKQQPLQPPASLLFQHHESSMQQQLHLHLHHGSQHSSPTRSIIHSHESPPHAQYEVLPSIPADAAPTDTASQQQQRHHRPPQRDTQADHTHGHARSTSVYSNASSSTGRSSSLALSPGPAAGNASALASRQAMAHGAMDAPPPKSVLRASRHIQPAGFITYAPGASAAGHDNQVLDSETPPEPSMLHHPPADKPPSVVFGFAPAMAVAQVQASEQDWKSRATAMESIYAASKSIDAQAFTPHVHKFAAFIEHLIQDDNFKITLMALHITAEAIHAAGPKIQPAALRLTDVLVGRFADNKIVIRQTCSKLLIQLMQATYPRLVYQCMLKHMASDHPRVREEILNTLIMSMLCFPSQDVDLALLAPALVAALRDPKAKVKYVAVEMCAVLASHMRAAPKVVAALQAHGLGKETADLLLLRFQDPALPVLTSDQTLEHTIFRSGLSLTPAGSTPAAGGPSVLAGSAPALRQPSPFPLGPSQPSLSSIPTQNTPQPHPPSPHTPSSPSKVMAKPSTPQPAQQPRALLPARSGSGSHTSTGSLMVLPPIASRQLPEQAPLQRIDSLTDAHQDESISSAIDELMSRVADLQMAESMVGRANPRRQLEPVTPTKPAIVAAADVPAGRVHGQRARHDEDWNDAPLSPVAPPPSDKMDDESFGLGRPSPTRSLAATDTIPKRPRSGRVSGLSDAPIARKDTQAIAAQLGLGGSLASGDGAASLTASTASLAASLKCATRIGHVGAGGGAGGGAGKTASRKQAPLDGSTAGAATAPKQRDVPGGVAASPAAKVIKFTEHDAKHVLEQLRPTQDWSMLMQGLTVLHDMLPDYSAAFAAFGHELVMCLIAHVQNLRTTVSKLAIQCIRDMCTYATKAVENDLDPTVACLLRKVGEGNAFIIDQVDQSLNSICEQFPPSKLIQAFVLNADHKNPLVRLRVAVLVDRVVSRLTLQQASRILTSVRDTEKMMPALVHFTREGFADTRNAAKHALHALSRFPEFGKAVAKVLNVSQSNEVREMVRNYVPKAEPMLAVPQSVSSSTIALPVAPSPSALKGGTVAAAPAHSTKQKPAPLGLDKHHDDEDDLQSALHSMSSDDWKTRYAAVEVIVGTIKARPRVVNDRPQMQLIFDVFAERCHDGNSKVGTQALNSLHELIPLCGATIDMAVASLVPIVANQMTGDPATVVQSLATIASFGNNIKVKALIVDTLSGVVDKVYPYKTHVMTKHVVPCCLRLLAENRTEVRDSSRKLVRKLHSLMGDELMESLTQLGMTSDVRSKLDTALQ